MDAKEFFETGRLDDAVAAAGDDVKKHPNDAVPRIFLAELLCFAGNLDRADLQLDALGHQDPQATMQISMFRQLVRAEQARRQFYEEGRLPDFLDEPAGYLKCHLEASIRLREGHPAEAVELLEEAQRQRPVVSGTCGDKVFEGIRDMDDLTASFFEVLTSTGKYYWIPMERVDVIEFRAPEQPRDLLWRRARMVVRGGPDGEVFLPALYANSHTEEDDRMRLGRFTDWRGGDGTPVQGIGQRMLLIGEDARSIMELEELTVTADDSETDDEQSST